MTTESTGLRARLEATVTDSERLAALLALAGSLVNRDPHEALMLAMESIELAGRMQDECAEAEGLSIAGVLNLEMGDYHHAEEQLAQALALYQRLGEKGGIAGAMRRIGNMYSSTSRYARALEQYQAGLAVLEELDDREGIARMLGDIGNVHAKLGEYSKALEQYQLALRLFEELGDRTRILIATGNIGHVYGSLGEYDKALEQYRLALALAEELGDRAGVARMTGSIGSIHNSQGEYDSALTHFHAALLLYEALDHRTGIPMMTGNMGIVHAKRGEYAKALEHYHSSLRLAEELGDRAQIARMTGRIGMIFGLATFEGYDPSLAENYLERAIELSLDLGDRRTLYGFHKEIAELYRHQGKWEQAYRHITQYHELKAEVQSIEAHKKAAQFEAQKQIAEMEKRRAIEQAEAKGAQEALEHRAQLLEVQLEHKQTELSSQALHLAKQTEMLSRFRNELREIVRRTNDAEKAIKAVKEKLKELPCATIDWEKFDEDFRGVHPNFESNLHERYPELTPMEMKICMLLKLQMTSADIATMLCLSERNIENHRYRIRQKMELTREQNLHQVLEGF
jgi:tetratricopeptide (TPR) repeat protein/DNA-binding CsgD family transcriptional regulator